jgi:hypothetical protein|tara:strand:+ start:2797 stop:3039 length:243 start_codon:yes stop_codon:yes gene_type:complete
MWFPPTLSGIITLLAPANLNLLLLFGEVALLIIVSFGLSCLAVRQTKTLSASLGKVVIIESALSIPALIKLSSSVAFPSI